MMWVQQRDYTLLGHNKKHAHVRVIPTGKIQIIIVEDGDEQEAEFDQIKFNYSGSKTSLVCGDEKSINWKIDLNNHDANELKALIQSAKEEYEILMRDL